MPAACDPAAGSPATAACQFPADDSKIHLAFVEFDHPTKPASTRAVNAGFASFISFLSKVTSQRRDESPPTSTGIRL